ncbi:MAG: UDP-galactopyranose mutase [Planctomycetota bacterium]|jgi:UDP-galactopyranose mutase
MAYDYIVVGAGFSGAVFARTLAESGKNILLLEERGHIGGNSFDMINSSGVIIHPYGAHIFHTDFENAWNYLSRFTKWRKYEHEVLAFVDGDYIPIPFNFNSLEKVFKEDSSSLKESFIQKYGLKSKISILEIIKEDSEDLRLVGSYIYEKIFKNYTMKQWGLKPDEISPDVISRVPVYTGYDNRYFTDTYQGIPKDGYATMFKNILSHPKIEVHLNTSFNSIGEFKKGKILLDGTRFNGILIYTGQVDILLKYKFGQLPYRSLRLEFETLDQNYYQQRAVINYPNDYEYTRIIESKHITNQKCCNTTICREYPQPHVSKENEPYYPISTSDSTEQYELYAAEAAQYDNLLLAGRLAEYKYYDMDDAINNALEKVKMLL